ncbi:MAG: Tetratricopeptide repeat protein [Phycisphaerales bacterium]|nr:Tetratricopeptide repeat protein [Phycisphaerales bacterium]
MHLAPTAPSPAPRPSRRARGPLLALAAAGLLATAAGGCADVLQPNAGEPREAGIKLYNAGQYPEAAGSFANAVKQRPQDYEAHYYLGRTYESMRNYHQAVGSYRTALTVMSNSLKGADDAAFRLKVLDGMASAIAAGQDPSLEQAAFSRTGGPKAAEDFFVLAKVRRAAGDADSALTEYQKAGALDPGSFAVAKEHGLYLLQLNQRTKGIEELKRAYALNYRARKPDDEQLNTALRAGGVIPGPSLTEGKDLPQPVLPVGPLPELGATSPPPAGGGR